MEKNKVNYIVYILLFCVLIAGIGGFYLGKNFYDKQNGEKEDKKETEVKMTDAEIYVLGKELFEKTSVNHYYSTYYFYEHNNYDSMKTDGEALSNIIFVNALNNGFVETNTETCDYSTEEGDNYNVKPCYTHRIKLDDYTKTFESIFGNDKKVPYDMVTHNDNFTGIIGYKDYIEQCKIENDYYTCYEFGGGDWIDFISYIYYSGTELVNDELYVYSKYLGYGPSYVTDEKGLNKEDKYFVYKNEERTDIIEYNDSITRGYFTEDSIFYEYKDKAGTYKLTFKQDSDDNWYWISTEYVK